MSNEAHAGELPEYLYHTTYIHALGGIQAGGLRPGAGSTWGAGSYYGAYSAGKLFLSDAEGVSYWVSKYGDQAEANTDNPEEGWVPVVLRFYLDNYQVDLEVDEHGAEDSSAGSWTTKHSVPPDQLEIWDGEDWVSLKSVSPDQMLEQALEAAEYESEDDEGFDEYGQPTGWWIMDYDVFLPPDESMEEWEENPTDEEVEAYRAEMEREHEERMQRRAEAAKLLDENGLIAIGKPPQDRFLMLHPSTVIDGGWQVSAYDRRSPFSHVEGEDRDKVIADAIDEFSWGSDDYRAMSEAEFMKITSTPEFQKGVLQVQAIGLENTLNYKFSFDEVQPYILDARAAETLEEKINILQIGLRTLKRQRGRKNPDIDRIEQMADEGYGDFEDYYPESAAGELEATQPWYGRNVIWDGIDGRMIRVNPEYARAMDGNIFDPNKLASIVSGIQQAEERVVFTAPYGMVSVIGFEDIRESIVYAEDNPDQVLTTGDEELDRYLVEGEEFITNEYGPDPNEPDEKEEYLEIRNDLEARWQEAEDEQSGDLGELTFQIRDGNHRAFGAMIAGEPYIYMIVTKNQIQDLKKYPNERDNQIILEHLE